MTNYEKLVESVLNEGKVWAVTYYTDGEADAELFKTFYYI